jgi:hypothetical protein
MKNGWLKCQVKTNAYDDVDSQLPKLLLAEQEGCNPINKESIKSGSVQIFDSSEAAAASGHIKL